MHKTSKEERADRQRVETSFYAGMDAAEKEPRPDTWSANMPAYAYTELCPDPELREWPGKEAPVIDRPVQGIRPFKVDKICLICRKVWPADTDRKNCDCEQQGHLYAMGTYYQKKTGGSADVRIKGYGSETCDNAG